MAGPTTLRVFYARPDAASPLILVRSVRGGMGMTFVDAAPAAVAARHEDEQLALDEAAAKRHLDGVALWAEPDGEQPEVPDGTIMRIALPGDRSAYFAIDARGEPSTDVLVDSEAVVSSLPVSNRPGRG